MATVAMTWHNTSDGGTHINVRLENLTYDSGAYDAFSLEIYQWDGSAWNFYDYKDYIQGEWSGTSYIYYEFTDNAPNHSYYAIGWAKWAGVWYDTYSSSPETIYPEIALADSWISSTSPHSFTLYAYSSYGYKFVYLYDYTAGTYKSLAQMYNDHGLSYSWSGNYLTVYNWMPSGWVDILVDVYLKYSNGYYTNEYSEKYVGGTAGALNVPSSPTTNHRLNVGFDMSWGYCASSDFYQCRYKTTGGYTETGYFYGYTNQNVWVDNQWGTTYYISARSMYTAWNGGEYGSSWSSDNQATTAPKLCSIASIDTYGTHITFGLTGFSGGWTRILVEYSTDYSYSSSQYVTNPTTTADITGLSSGTTYNFRISVLLIVSGVTIPTIIWDGSGNEYVTTTIGTLGGRPVNWSWTTTITAGGATYGIDYTNKLIKVITATEWNNFCNRINQFRVYKGLSTYSFTTVTTNDQFLATYFNQARTAIDNCSPSTAVPSSVGSGDKISASSLNGLSASLNSIT